LHGTTFLALAIFAPKSKGEFVDGQIFSQLTGEHVDGQTIVQLTGEFVGGQTIGHLTGEFVDVPWTWPPTSADRRRRRRSYPLLGGAAQT
jgi:hypothetical protein